MSNINEEGEILGIVRLVEGHLGHYVYGIRGIGERYNELCKWVNATPSVIDVGNDFPVFYIKFDDDGVRRNFEDNYNSSIFREDGVYWEGKRAGDGTLNITRYVDEINGGYIYGVEGDGGDYDTIRSWIMETTLSGDYKAGVVHEEPHRFFIKFGNAFYQRAFEKDYYINENDLPFFQTVFDRGE